jgi:hypothetical protein
MCLPEPPGLCTTLAAAIAPGSSAGFCAGTAADVFSIQAIDAMLGLLHPHILSAGSGVHEVCFLSYVVYTDRS